MNGIRITLDAGHGRFGNQSPIKKEYYEGERMFLLASYLKAELEEKGFEVYLTRKQIIDDPVVTDRGKMSGDNKSDLFISLHSNAVLNNETDGTYVFYSLTKPENITLANRLGRKVADIMKHKFKGSLIKEYAPGIKRDYYGVLRGASENGCKEAFIIEHGFHTNLKDVEFLLVDENLKKLAKGEAEVIAEYFGVNIVIYKVQVGAFTNKKYAEALSESYRKKGYATYVVALNNVYRVQLGAFTNKQNAEELLKKLKSDGSNAFVIS